MGNYPDIVRDAKPGYLIYRPFRPLATYAILGVNFVVFLVMIFADASSHPPLGDLLLRTFTGISFNPELLLRFGASFGPYTRRGEYWRLVMPMFLHIGLLHLFMNNYALYVLGQLLERIYGYGRFACLYVAAGVGSALISMMMSNNVSAGASGAIFGIAGIMLVAGYLHRESIPREWGRAFGKGILPLIAVNLLLGIALHQFVDNWGHLGGLASGIVLGLLIPPPQREFVPGLPMEKSARALTAIPVVVVAIAMVATVQNYRTNIAATRLLQEGERYRALKRDDLAAERFQEAAARSPRDERPHEELGSLHMGQEHWTDAIREYDQALRLNPTSLEAPLGLAQAYIEQGDPARAEEYLQSVQNNFGHTAEAQDEVASLYSQHKLYAEAIEHYQEALRLDPDNAEAQNDLAWLYATSDDPKFRNSQAALEHARRAVELTHWTQAGVIDTLAEAMYANQDFAEAVKVQTKALALEPHNQELADHMARYRKAAASLPPTKSSS